MANNRMLLICNVCHPKKGEWSYHEKGTLVIAKWYPGYNGGGNYYRNDGGEGMGEEFTKFLEEHEHFELPSEHYSAGAGQENPVRLEYESDGLPILNENDKLMQQFLKENPMVLSDDVPAKFDEWVSNLESK